MRIATWSTTDIARASAVAACCVGGLVVSINCKPSGPTPAPTTASSSVSFRMSSSGAPKCTANLRWEWTPINVGSGGGVATPVTLPMSGFTLYEVFSTTDVNPDRGSHCDFNADPLAAFAPGQWRITLVDPVAGALAQCQVTLRVGANWAGFRQFVPTCKETPAGSIGIEYP